MNKIVVGIRFQDIGKLYHFDATRVAEIRAGDFAVVKTSRGMQLGQVVGIIEDPPRPPKGTWKRIERKATPADLLIRQDLAKNELEAMIYCRERAVKRGHEGLKIVKVELSFDNETMTILYNTEMEEEVNLNSLRKDMRETYPDHSVEFRRIGPRDVAKIIGGMGACGMESRCCSTFITEFSPISIKMAKEQGVSLDPSEITGMCGRLRCCLIYEYEQYVEARKTLPKRKKRVDTPKGPGKVIDLIPLQDMVVVWLEGDNGGRAEFHRDEIEPWDEREALRRKAAEKCEHGNGNCNCRKANGDSTQQGDAEID